MHSQEPPQLQDPAKKNTKKMNSMSRLEEREENELKHDTHIWSSHRGPCLGWARASSV